MKRRLFLKFFGLGALIPSALLAKPKLDISDYTVETRIFNGETSKYDSGGFTLPSDIADLDTWVKFEQNNIFIKNGVMYARDLSGNNNHLVMKGWKPEDFNLKEPTTIYTLIKHI